MSNDHASLHLRFGFHGRHAPQPIDLVGLLFQLELHYRARLWGEDADREDELRPLPPPFRMTIKSVEMHSPLDLILEIPREFVVAGGLAGLFAFVTQVERLWNMPKRIRLEGAQLDRDYWQAAIERDEARSEFKQRARSGGPFRLEEGTLELPMHWDRPERPQARGK